MIYPIMVNRLATDIVGAWKSKRSNYIIVSPPFSDTHRLFKLLTDIEFQHKVLNKDAELLAVAKIGQGAFRNPNKLVTAILNEWGIIGEITINPDNPLICLDPALEMLEERGKIPVILVDRFHDAIKHLDGDFGIILRNLENEHFLKTVVSLPITLDELRERAKADPEGSLFLQSDWGQGHRVKMLRGYLESEVCELAKERGLGDEIANLIYIATAGLPELVDRLIDEVGKKNLSSLEHYLRAESPSRCGRLLDWLDCKGGDIYQRLTAESLQAPNACIGVTSLKDHSWSELLLGKDGIFTCRMLGWASIERLSRTHNRAFIEMVTDHAQNRRFSKVEGLLPSNQSAEEVDHEVWKALRVAIRFCSSADVLQKKWIDTRKCLSEISQLASNTKNVHIAKVAKTLSRWEHLINLMCAYFLKKKDCKDLRLEEFVCQQNNQEAIVTFLQFHRLRLQMAADLEPLAAMKLIIEQPESLMQVYGFYKFGVQFWNFPGLEDATRERVEKIFRRPFRSPSIGQRLGFRDILCLIYIKGEDTIPEVGPFTNTDEVDILEAQYRTRCEQVHSASFASSGDWNAYQRSCLELMKLLEGDILGGHLVEPLPDPVESFCDLAKTLRDIPRPS